MHRMYQAFQRQATFLVKASLAINSLNNRTNPLPVLGAGPIGVEFAHVFDSAGTDVTIIQHNVRLVPKEDADMSEHLLNNYRERGINII